MHVMTNENSYILYVRLVGHGAAVVGYVNVRKYGDPSGRDLTFPDTLTTHPHRDNQGLSLWCFTTM